VDEVYAGTLPQVLLQVNQGARRIKEDVINKCKNYLEILKKRDNAGGQNYAKRILKNVGCNDVEWSHMTRDRIPCWVFVGTVTKYRTM